jgi:hypothetical protein
MKFQSTVFLLLLFVLSSCAGYRVRRDTNPFAQYQIQRIAVPMFVNRSSFPQLSGVLTSEIRMMLADFPGLAISASEDANADAVLVGIIDSPDSLIQASKNIGTTFIAGDLKESIGERPAYYLPTVSTLDFNLTLVLIKRPSKEDLELVDTPFLPFLSRHPKVIFTEQIPLNTSYSRTIQETLGPDSPGMVNATRNAKNRERALKDIAKSASYQLKEVVIRAF